MQDLTIHAIRDAFDRHHDTSPIVITSPTGSGKSTQVPRWCSGRVLIVEPRRVACRSLASHVAQLEACSLGSRVGYQVRDESRSSKETNLLFATPGVVLRKIDETSRFDTVVIDEFHERRLDVDLLLALLHGRVRRMVVMSATMDGERVARHLGGIHLRAEGRQHPVAIRYLPGGAFLPDPKGLVARMTEAVHQALAFPGDILVFVPGKAEIAAVAQALRLGVQADVIELHGGLTLEQQSLAFEPSAQRKIIVATNVAETSITIPGIGVVVDTGLVRRTRYHQGRGFLTKVPIAMDAADQRAGRAGRTGPGLCLRLWSTAAKLDATTPAEVHRESLVPLVLAAAACGAFVEELPFLDPPKPHAIESAREDLLALGAIDEERRLTDLGRDMFGLPLDPWLGRLIVEARRSGALEDIIDLVAALEVGRPLFVGTGRPVDPQDDLRAGGCDATALIRAVRTGIANLHGLSPFVLSEARATARRLRRMFQLGTAQEKDKPIDRGRLIRTALAADSRCAHVARRRRSRVAWSHGGTEIDLAKESAVNGMERVDAIVVFDTRAVGIDARRTRIVATCATPVTFRELVAAGLGRDRVAGARVEEGRVVATIEQVFARKVIGTRQEVPEGPMARQAIVKMFLDGDLFPEALRLTEQRLKMAALGARLAASTLAPPALRDAGLKSPPTLSAWTEARLDELGVESGDDLALIVATDLTAQDVPLEARRLIEREYPLEVHLGDAHYEVDYDLARQQVFLRMVRGQRKTPPPLSYLPRFHGFRVCVEAGGTVHVVQER